MGDSGVNNTGGRRETIAGDIVPLTRKIRMGRGECSLPQLDNLRHPSPPVHTFDMVGCTILLQYRSTVRSLFTANEDVDVPGNLRKLMRKEGLGLSERV